MAGSLCCGRPGSEAVDEDAAAEAAEQRLCEKGEDGEILDVDTEIDGVYEDE